MAGDDSVTESTGKLSYSTKVKYINEISKPLASKTLSKKIYKLVKKGNSFVLHNYHHYYLLRISLDLTFKDDF